MTLTAPTTATTTAIPQQQPQQSSSNSPNPNRQQDTNEDESPLPPVLPAEHPTTCSSFPNPHIPTVRSFSFHESAKKMLTEKKNRPKQGRRRSPRVHKGRRPTHDAGLAGGHALDQLQQDRQLDPLLVPHAGAVVEVRAVRLVTVHPVSVHG